MRRAWRQGLRLVARGPAQLSDLLALLATLQLLHAQLNPARKLVALPAWHAPAAGAASRGSGREGPPQQQQQQREGGGEWRRWELRQPPDFVRAVELLAAERRADVAAAAGGRRRRRPPPRGRGGEGLPPRDGIEEEAAEEAADEAAEEGWQEGGEGEGKGGEWWDVPVGPDEEVEVWVLSVQRRDLEQLQAPPDQLKPVEVRSEARDTVRGLQTWAQVSGAVERGGGVLEDSAWWSWEARDARCAGCRPGRG